MFDVGAKQPPRLWFLIESLFNQEPRTADDPKVITKLPYPRGRASSDWHGDLSTRALVEGRGAGSGSR